MAGSAICVCVCVAQFILWVFGLPGHCGRIARGLCAHCVWMALFSVEKGREGCVGTWAVLKGFSFKLMYDAFMHVSVCRGVKKQSSIHPIHTTGPLALKTDGGGWGAVCRGQ